MRIIDAGDTGVGQDISAQVDARLGGNDIEE